ncbi:MAG: hypothetical protein AAGF10_05760, partial [Verrucomicrobiota bacterium]
NEHHGPGTDPGGASVNIYDPSNDWNGVVYVQFPVNTETDSSSASADVNIDGGTQMRYDGIVTGNDPFIALQMVNASEFPRPSYAKEKGLTLATNAPLYTVGNVNADGSSHTNDANLPDNQSEPPGAVVSDTLTVLSNKWYPESAQNRENSNKDTTGGRKANYTEFSAAILTGLKPTIPDDSPYLPDRGAKSGGAHNFPRFLENWGGQTLTIRGSLVALFESEVHRLAMPSQHGHYYSPPKRDWGFNDNFRNGDYPPGTPNTRTYRRVFTESMPKYSKGTVGADDYQEGYLDAYQRMTADTSSGS